MMIAQYKCTDSTPFEYVVSYMQLLHGNIDQTLVNSLHGLLNFETGELDCRVITTEYLSRFNKSTCNTYLCYSLFHIKFISVVSGQYSYTIHIYNFITALFAIGHYLKEPTLYLVQLPSYLILNYKYVLGILLG